MEVHTTPDILMGDLRDYGEDAVADLVPGFDDGQLHQVWVLAGRNLGGGTILLAKALALAAVEVAEGAPRPLHRNRRVFRR
jgi:hypothetical protein